jgi:hypothetical protein
MEVSGTWPTPESRACGSSESNTGASYTPRTGTAGASGLDRA